MYKHNNSILQQDRLKQILSFQQFPLNQNTIFNLALIKQGHHESLE